MTQTAGRHNMESSRSWALVDSVSMPSRASCARNKTGDAAITSKRSLLALRDEGTHC